ncbi:MAG: single-stranded DNA-binding protein [Microscillaceae bacterium]|nr:single-stranded DNA-binding protein [Microscillaceae bacterium]MDW8459809.1 single-stranded DNA-binding protein [Cytophagales bacterium]
MASLSKITLIGNVGADPEVRIFENKKVANFSLAVNEKYTKANGEQVEKTDWFRVSFWGNIADVVEKYVRKGTQVYVEGKLSTREYMDRNNEKRFALEVTGQTLTLLGSKENSNSAGNTAPTATQESYPTNDISADNDDLPF